jgi:hypothetical protein
LDDAHTLATIEAAAEADTLSDLLLPLGVGLGLPTMTVDEATALRLSQGQRVILETAADSNVDQGLALAQSAGGVALGILRCLESQPGRALWKAEKWLAIN